MTCLAWRLASSRLSLNGGASTIASTVLSVPAVRSDGSIHAASYPTTAMEPRRASSVPTSTSRSASKRRLRSRRSKASLADALAAGQVMAFEWDAVTGQSRRSDNAARILGDDRSAGGGSMRNEFLKRVHPDDRRASRRSIRNSSRTILHMP